MSFSRRDFLIMTGLGLGVGSAGYSYYRGLRFPPPIFTFNAPVTQARTDQFEVSAEGAIYQATDENVLQFRAFVPEPRIVIRNSKPGPWEITVENISADAQLIGEPRNIVEHVGNLKRVVRGDPVSPEEHQFGWKLPDMETFRFAIIGDTGGGLELAWTLERASALGAKFLLHLGDINYEQGDMSRAIRNFNEAAIPSYVSIGNHDYREGLQLMYPEFNQLIGPNNFVFSLGGVEFVNFDTATGFLPVARGQRARLFQTLGHIDQSSQIRDRVFFTHKPLKDPMDDRNHTVSIFEESWLKEQILSRGSNKLFAGHIHIKEEFDDEGLQTYISGQGLAHVDLIAQRQLAEILIGEVVPGEPVSYQWHPLNMPYNKHCSLRSITVPEMFGRPEETQQNLQRCGKS